MTGQAMKRWRSIVRKGGLFRALDINPDSTPLLAKIICECGVYTLSNLHPA